MGLMRKLMAASSGGAVSYRSPREVKAKAAKEQGRLAKEQAALVREQVRTARAERKRAQRGG